MGGAKASSVGACDLVHWEVCIRVLSLPNLLPNTFIIDHMLMFFYKFKFTDNHSGLEHWPTNTVKFSERGFKVIRLVGELLDRHKG